MKFNFQTYSQKSGIYKITNTHTGRVYIGQAKEFKQRWNGHASSLRRNEHQNKFLQNDYNKCKEELGNDDFLVFEIIEVLEGLTKEDRNKREDEYLLEYFDGSVNCYNFMKSSNDSKERSCSSYTPEITKKKQSDALKKRWENYSFREYMSNLQKEKFQDEDYKKQQLEKMLPPQMEERLNPEYSISIGKKISETKKKNGDLISEKLRERWKNVKFKEEISAKLKMSLNTQEVKDKKRKAFENLLQDEEKIKILKEKQSEHAKKLWKSGLLGKETEESHKNRSTAAKKLFEEGKLDHLKEMGYKPLYEYQLKTPDGNTLIFSNLKEKAEELNFEFEKFKRVCYGQIKEYEGYEFIRRDRLDGTIVTPKSPKPKPKKEKNLNKKRDLLTDKVRQIEIETGNVVQVFDSITVAAKALNKYLANGEPMSSNIAEVCKGNSYSAFGFKWEYDDRGLNSIYPRKDPPGTPKSHKAIAMLDEHGNIKRKFGSIAEAAREMKINSSAVSIAVNKKDYKKTRGIVFVQV